MGQKVNRTTKIRNRIRGARRPVAEVSKARASVRVSEYPDLVEWLTANHDMGRRILPQLTLHSARDIRRHPPLAAVDFEREIRWAAEYLQRFPEHLARFVSSVTEIETQVLHGDAGMAMESLDSLVTEYGPSLWSIRLRVALLQEVGGLEAQKQYAADIKRSAQGNGVVPYIVHEISVRNEESVTVARFRSRINQQLSQFQLGTPLDLYIRHLVLPDADLEFASPNVLLAQFGTSTLFDYYEAFVRAAQLGLVAGQFDASVVAGIRTVYESSGDTRLLNLVKEEDSAVDAERRRLREMRALHALMRGACNEAHDLAEEGLSHDRPSLQLSWVLARCQQHEDKAIPKPSLLQSYVRALQDALTSTAGLSETTRSVEKALLNLEALPIAVAMRVVLDQERRSARERGSSIAAHIAALADPFSHALRDRVYLIRGGGLNSSGAGFGAASEPMPGGVEPPAEWTTEETAFTSAYAALDIPDHDSVLHHSAILRASEDPYYRVVGEELWASALLETGKMLEAVDFIARIASGHEQLRSKLPVQEAVASLRVTTLADRGRRISVPILYDIQYKMGDLSCEAQRRFSYEDFLIARNVSRPSELESGADYSDEELIYFWRELCVENVMDVSVEFSGSLDLRKERLAVCRKLVELDASNADIYQAEIRDLLQRIMVQERLREVEESKIYVDLEGIYRASKGSLQEQFERYLAFVREGVDQDLQEFARLANEKATAGDIEGILKLAVPQNERVSLLQSIITDLRDEFVANAEYGLDLYLSVRIRHGTLSGELRSPLEAAQLITQKDKATDSYRPNTYWVDRLHPWDSPESSELDRLLKEFSAEYDKLIGRITGEWLQIKKSEADSGLFEFAVPSALGAVVADQIGPETSFDEMFEIVMGVLWEQLDANLKRVRAQMESGAKGRANEMLIELQTRIERLDLATPATDLVNALNTARVEVQNAFDRVIAWFRLPREGTDEPFHIADAVHLAMEAAKTGARELEVDLKESGSEDALMFEGRKLTTFVDIFFMLLDNVGRHSGFVGKSTALIEVEFQEDEVGVRVSNPLAPVGVDEEARRYVDQIRSYVETEAATRSLAQEGGTGFLKLWRILKRDFTEPVRLDFGFASDTHFRVEFSFPVVQKVALDENPPN